MVYNELCHKEIDWSSAMKKILTSLVAAIVSLWAISTIVLTASAHPEKSPETNAITHCQYVHPVAMTHSSLMECASTHWLMGWAEL